MPPREAGAERSERASQSSSSSYQPPPRRGARCAEALRRLCCRSRGGGGRRVCRCGDRARRLRALPGPSARGAFSFHVRVRSCVTYSIGPPRSFARKPSVHERVRSAWVQPEPSAEPIRIVCVGMYATVGGARILSNRGLRSSCRRRAELPNAAGRRPPGLAARQLLCSPHEIRSNSVSVRSVTHS